MSASRARSLAALLLCSWALVAAAAGGAAWPRCEHTCSLELRGSGSASPPAPVSASLSCSCSAADCPPLAVAYNSSIIPEAMAAAFSGVSPRPVSLATHPELNYTVGNTTYLRRPMLYFRGDGSTLVRFERPVVRGVRLPVGAEADLNIFMILRFVNVTATIVNGSFSDNEANVVVVVHSGSALDVLGLNATRNRVYQGVLSTTNSSVNVTRLACTGNSAAYVGGCIVAWNSSVVLRDAVLQSNTARESAGCISAANSSVALWNTTLRDNRAGYAGGGIAAMNSSLTLRHSVLFNNNASAAGGGIYASTSLLTLQNATLKNNTASGGGAVFSGRSSNVTLVGCTIANNSALTGGGILAVSTLASTLVINDTRIAGNAARYVSGVDSELQGFELTGGGLFIDGAHAAMHNTTIANNDARLDAGGIACETCTLDLANVTLANNTATRLGGAIGAEGDATINIRQSRFSSNRATIAGGALLWATQADDTTLKAMGSVSVQGSKFADNSAGVRGGAIATLPSGYSSTLVPAALAPLVLRGNTFDRNFAPAGATLDVGLIFNLSLADNTDVRVSATNLQLTAPRSNLTASDFGVVWRKRDCLRGEHLVRDRSTDDSSFEMVCELCAPFSYSLVEGNVTDNCTACPVNARCFGGAVIVSADGHWHGDCPTINVTCNYTLADITRCPNMAACRHMAKDLEPTHPYSVGARAARVSLGGQYEAQQCNGSAYSGPLCGSCAAGYGQTTPFTCKRCLTKRGNDQQLDLAGISMLWVTYWLVQTALLLTTVAASLPDSGKKDGSNKGSSGDSKASSADCTVGIDDKAAAPSSSDSSTLHNWPVLWTEVFKAVSIYQSYLMILLNLPVSWLPFMSHTGGGGGGSHGGFVGFVLTIVGLVNGAPASLDCLMEAHGITWSPRTAAVFKALINLAAIPLVHLASLLVLQLAWFFVGDAAMRTASAVGMWLWFWLRHGGRQPKSAAPDPPASRLKPEGLGPFMRDRAVVSLLVVMFKFYPSLVHVALRMFMCVRIGTTRLWIVDVAIACPLGHATGEGAAAYAVGIVALTLVTAWPLAIAGLLWWGAHKDKLAEDGDSVPNHVRKFRTWFGFLYLGAADPSASMPWLVHMTRQGRMRVKLHVNWRQLDDVLKRHIVLAWDAVVDVQRFALVAISLAVMLHEYYQVLLLCLALGLYLMLVLVVRPFSAPAVHRLTVAMLACLWLSCLGILCVITPAGMPNPLLAEAADKLTAGQLAAREAQETLRIIVSWLLAVVNGAVIVVAAVMLLACLHGMCQPMRERLRKRLREKLQHWIEENSLHAAAPERAATSRACCWC